MITKEIKRQTHTRGAKESKEFSINASAKAFRALAGMLYSDIISTVIRELSTNAVDAHIEEGTQDKAFDVQLPTLLDPVFRIRDYGIGMEYDMAMELYSQMFYSTKSLTNALIGTHGLGSKAPFGYTDSFSVTSYRNGEAMFFQCAIGEDGVPKIHHIQTIYTEEPNGLEVSVPVKKEDIGEFYTRAAKIWRHFDPLPNVSGPDSDEFSIDLRKYVTSGEDWKVFKPSDYYYNTSPIAVMGLIEYPIEPDKLIGVSEDDRRLLRNMPIELHFGIGELEISTSRENLGYDERTSINIINKAKKAIDAFTKNMREAIGSAESFWDANLKLLHYRNSSSLLRDLISRKKFEITWNGRPVTGVIECNYKEFPDTFTYTTYSISERMARNTYNHVEYLKASASHVCNGYGKHDTSRLYIHVAPTTEIWINDKPSSYRQRIRNYLDNASGEKAIIAISDASAETLAVIKEKIGCASYKLVSELPKPERNTDNTKKERGEIPLWSMDVVNYLANVSRYTSRWRSEKPTSLSSQFEAVVLDSKELASGGFYLPAVRRFPTTSDWHFEKGDSYNRYGNEHSSMETLLSAARILGVIPMNDNKVYVVNENKVSALVESGKWKNLATETKKALKKAIKKSDLQQYILFSGNDSDFNNRAKDELGIDFRDHQINAVIHAIDMVKRMAPNADIGDTDAAIEELKMFTSKGATNLEKVDEYRTIIRAAGHEGIKIESTDYKLVSKNVINAIRNKFPMMRMLINQLSTNCTETYKLFEDYIVEREKDA